MEQIGWGFAPAVGPKSSRLLFVGEALGYEEAIAGEPFFGAAGGVLSRILHRAGIVRNHVRIANIVSCFPGETLVHAEGLHTAYRRLYDGDMVAITTDRGVLSATPNHPILTLRGWVPAGEINESDHLIYRGLGEGVRGGDPNVERRPARIDQAFHALSVFGVRQRIVGRDVDFHGDGRDGEIEVVSLNGELRHGFEAARAEEILHLILEATSDAQRLLVLERTGGAAGLDLLLRRAAAPRRCVRSVEHLLALVARRAGPALPHGLPTGSYFDPGFLEESVKAPLSDAELVGEPFDAVPVAVEPTRVRKVEGLWFSGHVYNLATLSEQYTANGFVVHNCRPPDDYLAGAPWEQMAIAQCRQYLQPILDELPDNGVIVPLGATALGAILRLAGVPGVAVKDFHGTVNRSPDDRHWVVPTFHPSHLQRGAMNLLEVVTEDIKRAEKVSREGFVRSKATIVIDPPTEWFGRWVDGHLAKVAADVDGEGLDADTEFTGKSDDEGEIVNAGKVNLTRFNFSNDGVLGGSVPYVGEYIRHIDRLLSSIAQLGGWIYWWNKYVDVEPLAAAGHRFHDAQNLDLMWLAHHIQSDLPRGLGFWAPFGSDYGPWKHLSKQRGKEGEYAAVDGLQTSRVRRWLIREAHRSGMMEMFLRDWHERDRYVLRPAHALGVPVNRPALVAYHEDMQRKLGVILGKIKETAARGVLKPKLGYAKRPTVVCEHCAGEGMRVDSNPAHCDVCGGTGRRTQTKPPASILGKSKTGGGEAKLEYMTDGVRLIEADVAVVLRCCETCGAEGVGPKHRCPQPPAPRVKRGEPKPDRPPRPESRLVERSVTVRRWFWQLPFNPDAPQQVLAYLEQQGVAAPIDKKKKKATTKKDALKKLAKDYSDDPFYQLLLDWKAVQKVDSTYAVGSLRRLDSDDRLHPEYLPKPSTLRDSAVDPNLTNVVADKSGPDGLASGFRRCIEARDGVPPGTTAEQFAAWEARWGS